MQKKEYLLIQLITLMLLIVSSCNKETDNLNYDCLSTFTNYSPEGTVKSWYKYYYVDRLIVKERSSSGSETEIQYNSQRNPIVITSDGIKTVNEYDDQNRLVKTKTYEDDYLNYTSIYQFIDTLKTCSVTLNYNNDTIGWTKYYYNRGNKLDSLIANNHYEYYYYSKEMDSVIIKDQNKIPYQYKYCRYLNNHLVYEELKVYFQGTLRSKDIKTWEFNSRNLLVRETRTYMNYIMSGVTVSAADTRKLYNDWDDVSRTEEYDEDKNLKSYSIYNYENRALTKIEEFDPKGYLTGYTVIEKTCK